MAQQFDLTAQLNLQAPKNTSAVINDIRRQLKDVNIDVKVKNIKDINSANREMQNFNRSVKQNTKNVSELNRTLQESARRFSVITLATGSLLALANSFKNSTKAAIEFEREVIKISQVTGKSVSNLQGLTKEVTRLSTTLGASSSDLLSVSKILAQAGFSANDTRKALDILAKTSLGSTFENIQDTTEGAIAVLRQFTSEAQKAGGNIKFLEQTLDAVNSVSKSFAVESGDLITAIRRVGGVFSAAGGSVNELIALFTSVRSTTRESAETIATGLRTIFTRIQRTDTIDSLKKLNIQLSDSEGNFVGAFKAVERLSKGLSGLDPRSGTFSQIVEELGGFRQVGKVIPLIQQFTTAQNALNVAQGASGSVSKDAIKAQQGLGVQIQRVREQFDALIRKFADSSTFNTVITGALKLAESFIKIADALEPLLPLIAGLGFAKLGKNLAPAIGGIFNIGGSRANIPQNVSKFNSGGVVPGTGNRDTVPAMLTPGEFVIRKSSVKKLGVDQLQQMNNNRFNGGNTGTGINKDQGKVKTRAKKYIASGSGRLEGAHFGEQIPFDKERLASYLGNYAKDKVKSFQYRATKLKRTLSERGIDPQQIKNMAEEDVQALKKEINLEAKQRVKLKIPRDFNQALKRGDKGLVLQTGFVNALQDDRVFGDLGRLDDPNHLRSSIVKAIPSIINKKAGSYHKDLKWRGSDGKFSDMLAVDRDDELNELKNVITTSVDESARRRLEDNFDLMFDSSKKDALYRNRKTGQIRLRKQSREGGRLSRLALGGFVQRFANGGSPKKNAYIFDFDDTLATTEAKSFKDFSNPDFIESASATRYASLAKRRAAQGDDVHVLTARSGSKAIRGAIASFMAKNGIATKSIMGVGKAFPNEREPGKRPGTTRKLSTASKKQKVLENLAKRYGQITFLDDNMENILQASKVENVRAVTAEKEKLFKKFQVGGKVGIFDSDMIEDKAQAAAMRKAITDSKKIKRLIWGPAGSGKTTYAKEMYGDNFLKSMAHLDEYDDFIVLSGAQNTKKTTKVGGKDVNLSQATVDLIREAKEITAIIPEQELLISRREKRIANPESVRSMGDKRSEGSLKASMFAADENQSNEILKIFQGLKSGISVLRPSMANPSGKTIEAPAGTVASSGGKILGTTTATKKYTLEQAVAAGLSRPKLTKGFGKSAVDAFFGGTAAENQAAKRKAEGIARKRKGATDSKLTYGAAFLEKVTSSTSGERSVDVDGKKILYDFKTAYVDASDAKKIKDDYVVPQAKKAVQSIASLFANSIGAKAQKSDNIPNLPAITGSLYEAGLARVVGGGIADDADDNRIFDFPSGLKDAAGIFGADGKALQNVKTDAKVSSSSSALKSIRAKVKNDLSKNKFAKGGAAPSDTVPALLTPGEFVFSAESAKKIGYSNLNRMNKQGVQGYAAGGVVQRFANGTSGRGARAPGNQAASDVQNYSSMNVVSPALAAAMDTVVRALNGEISAISNLTEARAMVERAAEKEEKEVYKAIRAGEKDTSASEALKRARDLVRNKYGKLLNVESESIKTTQDLNETKEEQQRRLEKQKSSLEGANKQSQARLDSAQKVQGLASSAQSFVFLAGTVSSVATQFMGLSGATEKAMTQIIGLGTTAIGIVGTIADVGVSLYTMAIQSAINKRAMQIQAASEAMETTANEAAAASEYEKIAANKAGIASEKLKAGSDAASSAASGAAGAAGGGAGLFKGLFSGIAAGFKAILAPLALAVVAVVAVVGAFKYLQFKAKALADEAGESAEKMEQAFEEGSGGSAIAKRETQIRQLNEANISGSKASIAGVGGIAGGVAAGAGIATAVALGASLGSVVPVVGTVVGALAGMGVGLLLYKDAQEAANAETERQVESLREVYTTYENLTNSSLALKNKFEEISSLDFLTPFQRASRRVSAMSAGSGASTAADESFANLKEFFSKSSSGVTFDDLTSGESEIGEGFSESDKIILERSAKNLVTAIDQIGKDLAESRKTLAIAREEALKDGGSGGLSDSQISGIITGSQNPVTLYGKALKQTVDLINDESRAKRQSIELQKLSNQVEIEKLKKEDPSSDLIKDYEKFQDGLNKQLQKEEEANRRSLKNLAEGEAVARSVREAEVAAIKRSTDAQIEFANSIIAIEKTISQFQDATRSIQKRSSTLDALSASERGDIVTGTTVKLTESDITKIANPERFKREVSEIVSSVTDPTLRNKAFEAGEKVTSREFSIRAARRALLGQTFKGIDSDKAIKNLLIRSGFEEGTDNFKNVVKELKEGVKITPQEFNRIFSNYASEANEALKILEEASRSNEAYIQLYQKQLQRLNAAQEEQIEIAQKSAERQKIADEIRARSTKILSENMNFDLPDSSPAASKFKIETQLARESLRARRVNPELAGNSKALKSLADSLKSRIRTQTLNLQSTTDRTQQGQAMAEINRMQNALKGVNKELERLSTSTTLVDFAFEKMEKNSKLIDIERSKRQTLLGVLEGAVTGGLEGRRNLARSGAMSERAIAMGTLQGFKPEQQQQIVSFLRSLGDEIKIGATGKSGKELADALIARDVMRDRFIPPIFKQALANTMTSEERLIKSNQKLAQVIDRLADNMAGPNNAGVPIQRSKGGVVYRQDGGSIFKPKGTDTVPAMLTPGEFVMSKPAVDRIGVDTLSRINSGKSSTPKGLRRGGVLYAYDGAFVDSVKGSGFDPQGSMLEGMREFMISKSSGSRQDIAKIDKYLESFRRSGNPGVLGGMGNIRRLLSAKNREGFQGTNAQIYGDALRHLMNEFVDTVGFVDFTGFTTAAAGAAYASLDAAGLGALDSAEDPLRKKLAVGTGFALGGGSSINAIRKMAIKSSQGAVAKTAFKSSQRAAAKAAPPTAINPWVTSKNIKATSRYLQPLGPLNPATKNLENVPFMTRRASLSAFGEEGAGVKNLQFAGRDRPLSRFADEATGAFISDAEAVAYHFNYLDTARARGTNAAAEFVRSQQPLSPLAKPYKLPKPKPVDPKTQAMRKRMMFSQGEDVAGIRTPSLQVPRSDKAMESIAKTTLGTASKQAPSRFSPISFLNSDKLGSMGGVPQFFESQSSKLARDPAYQAYMKAIKAGAPHKTGVLAAQKAVNKKSVLGNAFVKALNLSKTVPEYVKPLLSKAATKSSELGVSSFRAANEMAPIIKDFFPALAKTMYEGYEEGSVGRGAIRYVRTAESLIKNAYNDYDNTTSIIKNFEDLANLRIPSSSGGDLIDQTGISSFKEAIPGLSETMAEAKKMAQQRIERAIFDEENPDLAARPKATGKQASGQYMRNYDYFTKDLNANPNEELLRRVKVAHDDITLKNSIAQLYFQQHLDKKKAERDQETAKRELELAEEYAKRNKSRLEFEKQQSDKQKLADKQSIYNRNNLLDTSTPPGKMLHNYADLLRQKVMDGGLAEPLKVSGFDTNFIVSAYKNKQFPMFDLIGKPVNSTNQKKSYKTITDITDLNGIEDYLRENIRGLIDGSINISGGANKANDIARFVQGAILGQEKSVSSGAFSSRQIKDIKRWSGEQPYMKGFYDDYFSTKNKDRFGAPRGYADWINRYYGVYNGFSKKDDSVYFHMLDQSLNKKHFEYDTSDGNPNELIGNPAYILAKNRYKGHANNMEMAFNDYPKFATGGTVPSSAAQTGMGMGTDTVPAMLTPGEFVIRKSSVDKYGTAFMNSLNSGTVQGLFAGGMPDKEKGKWKPAPHIPKKNYKRIGDNFTFQQAVQRGFIVPVEAAGAEQKAQPKPAGGGGAAGGGAGIAPLINQLQTTFTPLLTKAAENQATIDASIQGLIKINTKFVAVHEQINIVGANISSAASRLATSYDKIAEAMKTPLTVEATHTHNIEGMIYIANTGGIAQEIGNALGEIIKSEVGKTLPDLISEHLKNIPG